MQVLYIHGKGGTAEESKHYESLFPHAHVMGLDYQTFSPWDTGREIRTAVEKLAAKQEEIILIANSIGAFFSMNAGLDGLIQKAYFISPLQPAELSIFITELATTYKGLLRVFQVSGFPSV